MQCLFPKTYKDKRRSNFLTYVFLNMHVLKLSHICPTFHVQNSIIHRCIFPHSTLSAGGNGRAAHTRPKNSKIVQKLYSIFLNNFGMLGPMCRFFKNVNILSFWIFFHSWSNVRCAASKAFLELYFFNTSTLENSDAKCCATQCAIYPCFWFTFRSYIYLLLID